MLIQPKPTTASVVTLKFLGGDEVVARLVSENETNYTIKNPLVFVMGQQGWGLAPFVMSIDEDADIEINKTFVIAFHKTKDEVMKQYVKYTSNLIL